MPEVARVAKATQHKAAHLPALAPIFGRLKQARRDRFGHGMRGDYLQGRVQMLYAPNELRHPLVYVRQFPGQLCPFFDEARHHVIGHAVLYHCIP